jgi:hypothetical protein
MWLEFQIVYKTFIGQELMLVGSTDQLGAGNRQNAVKMIIEDVEAGLWSYQLEIGALECLSYRYFVKDS